MEEQMKAGAYTALQNINIRASMNTQITTNIVGGFRNGEPFTVYEVYPEVRGILWGRVSSNIGEGSARYVGLRVNNHALAKMEKPFEEEAPPASLLDWAQSIDVWARLNGFKGPRPG